MEREALLELNCSRYSEKIIDIINLLCKVGGAYVSDDEKVQYLQIGDKDDLGILLLADDTKSILICMSINRKTIQNTRTSITDIGWYFANIVKQMENEGCCIDYIRFEDYVD